MPVTPVHTRTTTIPLLALFAGAVALGSSPLLVRVSELEPTATAFYRVALAAPAFLLLSFSSSTTSASAPTSAAAKSELGWLIGAGAFFALDLLCLHWSLRYTTVANAILFLNFAPFFVALGGWLIFGEVPGLRTVASFVVAIGGIGLLVGGIASPKPDRVLGDLLGIGAGAAYGGYLLVVSRFRHRLSTNLVMGVSTFSSALFLLPVALAMGESIVPVTLAAWITLLALALLTHATGQGLLVFAMRYLPASTSSMTLLLQPVVAAYGAWIIFGESLSSWQMIGAGIVLAGIIICQDAAVRRTPETQNQALDAARDAE
jgi:drug/metabolite transporter (DMT)-like permease